MTTATEDKIFHKLDDIADRLARSETREIDRDKKLDQVCTNSTTLSMHGCVIGASNMRRLDALEERPAKILGWAVGLAGLVSTLFGFLGWILSVHLKRGAQ